MAEIRISELSIGDWMYHDDLVFGREIAKIHRLHKDKNYETIGITVYRSDGAFGVVGYIGTSPANNDIHPIPLTPEILEENGFVKNGEYNEWNIGTWKTPYLLGVSLERPAITIKWNGSSIFIDRAKYVHQLQHAFRLAGVGKEIEL